MPDLSDQTGPDSIAGNQPSPSVDNTRMGSYAQNTVANSNTQTPDGQPQPAPNPLLSGEAPLTGAPIGASPAGVADPAVAPAPAAASSQPNVYGGNFGNDMHRSYQDPTRQANIDSSLDRGELGVQGQLGGTHGGFGNQYRELDPAADHPQAEPTEEKYYGEGASRPGLQHNAYRAYDGHDARPDTHGHAVHDTPPPAQPFAAGPAPDHARQQQDTRNLPSRDDARAAFQNDNGAPTVGPAYATDYGHTSGASLPPGTPDNHLPLGPDGHGIDADPASARGGYDGQQSEAKNAPQGTPAPVDAPTAPQGEGYGYGYQQSEQAHPGNPQTGDARNGFGPGGSKEGDTSQGYGSKGGSYDDQNPGARPPAHDQYTYQEKAQNYGQAQRPEFRPADGDKPADGDYGPEPRRNAGRD